VNGQATYAFYDEGTAGRMLSTAELPTLPQTSTPFSWAGSALVNDPAASTYEALQARDCGTRVTMVDPNIRPGFIAGKEAEYRARIERMVARADIVKLSDEDLHWLEGQGDSDPTGARHLGQGAEGCLHHRRRERGAGGDRDAGPFSLPRKRLPSSIPSARATRSTRVCLPPCIRRGP
jgi:sugar/nucleoside kinase (ribokinase family)